MRVLIADDDEVSLLRLEALLRKRGYEPETATDGAAALARLRAGDPPGLAIVDWEMPGLDGVSVCRLVREDPALRGLYLLLLTARGGREHVVEGLRAGANDYVTKPFDPDELDARLRVAAQVVGLQAELATRVRELEAALARVKQLQGLLPICAYCKKVRDDQNYWHQVEHYVHEHSEARFSHGVCPGCWEAVLRPEAEAAGIDLPPAPD